MLIDSLKIKTPLLFLIAFMVSCSSVKTIEKTPTLLKIGGLLKNSNEEISGMDSKNK